eukprot:9242892-Karenia_brevis.AAC.1
MSGHVHGGTALGREHMCRSATVSLPDPMHKNDGEMAGFVFEQVDVNQMKKDSLRESGAILDDR